MYFSYHHGVGRSSVNRLPVSNAGSSTFDPHHYINQTWWHMLVILTFRRELILSDFLDCSPFYVLSQGLSLELINQLDSGIACPYLLYSTNMVDRYHTNLDFTWDLRV